ncbi:MAG: hypothetical protein HKN53_06650 [Maribacter sp.]|nr:hypothetical protein [Maribacter sp.]
MKAKIAKSDHKFVFSKIYSDSIHLLEAAEIITNESSACELSILGKTNILNSAQNKGQINTGIAIKDHLSKITKEVMECDYFYNPEIGYIFIIGPLTSIFLNDLEGKSLGAISVGPYGILRGLGISHKQTISHIKALKKGGYLMIVRGYDDDLDILENILRTKACHIHERNSQFVH